MKYVYWFLHVSPTVRDVEDTMMIRVIHFSISLRCLLWSVTITTPAPLWNQWSSAICNRIFRKLALIHSFVMSRTLCSISKVWKNREEFRRAKETYKRDFWILKARKWSFEDVKASKEIFSETSVVSTAKFGSKCNMKSNQLPWIWRFDKPHTAFQAFQARLLKLMCSPSFSCSAAKACMPARSLPVMHKNGVFQSLRKNTDNIFSKKLLTRRRKCAFLKLWTTWWCLPGPPNRPASPVCNLASAASGFHRIPRYDLRHRWRVWHQDVSLWFLMLKFLKVSYFTWMVSGKSINKSKMVIIICQHIFQ